MSTSRRGRPLIIVAGYKFHKTRSHGAKTYWNCTTDFHRGCRAVVHTLIDMTVIKCHNVHNHYGVTATFVQT